ncbi:MAG: hypothetical protein WCK75_11145 [Elusimicrobiota bacterium]
MAPKPNVNPSDWITIGKRPSGMDAVVCVVSPESGDIEVVYKDDLGKAISDEVVWRDDHWEFKTSGASGGYAENYDRLSSFVSQLRRGRI